MLAYAARRVLATIPVMLVVAFFVFSLLYLAPADATGHFQLWWLNKATALTPALPKQVTTNLDFDATSAPAWAP